MTLKSCRQMLEADMGVESGTLKPFKDLLGSLIDNVGCSRLCMVCPMTF